MKLKKNWEIIKTNEIFQEKENRELVQLFMKIDATQIPQKQVNEIKDILVEILKYDWCNTVEEEKYLSNFLAELRNE